MYSEKESKRQVLDEKGKIIPEYYKFDIEEYREFFEKDLQDILKILTDNGLITEIKSLEARIKSFASFKHNLETENRSGRIKKLDDCFGIKITLNENANAESQDYSEEDNPETVLFDLQSSKSASDNTVYEILRCLLKEGFFLKKIKDHAKIENTNYNAVHAVFEIKDTSVPFEIQIRTQERSKGRLPHDIYKYCGPNSELLDSEQKEVVLKVFEKIMKLNLNGKYTDFAQELPVYSYELYDANGKHKIKRLSDKEMIIKLFPTIAYLLGDNLQDYRNTEIDEKGLERFSKMLDALLLKKGEGINGRKQRTARMIFKILHKLTDDTLDDRKRKEALLLFDQITIFNRRINKVKSKLSFQNLDDMDPEDNF